MKQIKLVAAYARYSTDNQTENSIVYQMEKIKAYCLENSYTIVKKYKDEAKSGTNTNRKNFLSLMDAARNKEFDAVVIYDISRGSRDVADWFTFRKEMMVLGIEVISVQDKLGDLLDPNDFLVELLGVGIGQHQVLQTRQKSIDGVTSAARDAIFLGGCPPFGYDIKDRKYVINPHEAEIVKKIFKMYADGHSYHEIIDAIGPVTGKKGRPFGKSTLFAILKNDRYIGIYTWNRRRIKTMGKWAGGGPNENMVQIIDAIPRIIDQDTWERVQENMENNKRSGHKAKRNYLLSGLIHCESCGSMYCGRTSVNQRGYQNPYYVCGRKTNTRACTSKNIKAEKIETFVKNTLKSYLLSIDLSDVAKNLVEEINKCIVDRSSERQELIEVSSKIKNGTNAILNGLEYPELVNELKSLQNRKKELEDILSTSVDDEPVSEVDIEVLLMEMIDNLDDNIERVIKTFVVRINAHHDGSYTVVLGVAHRVSSGREI